LDVIPARNLMMINIHFFFHMYISRSTELKLIPCCSFVLIALDLVAFNTDEKIISFALLHQQVALVYK